jgi:ABC-type dipeptide/oligopeptide/nickel transport system permease subunit
MTTTSDPAGRPPVKGTAASPRPEPASRSGGSALAPGSPNPVGGPGPRLRAPGVRGAGMGTGTTADAEVVEPTSSWRLAIAMFRENHLAVAGAVVLGAIILFSFVGPLVYPTNQAATNLINENLPPSASHWLGTSPEGFDELGRLMVAGRSTLLVGFGVGVLAALFGLLYGTLAGFLGGVVDAVMMRIVDALLSIPYLFFVVLLAALVQPNLLLVIFMLAAVTWLATARLVRGETLSLRTRDYVTASRGFGSGPRHVVLRHITPNLLGVVVVNATLNVADSILAFAGLAYLGLGPPPPATSWGQMLSEGIDNLFDGYWWQLWPSALLIVLTVLAVNLIGDGLSDVVEIRLQRR